MTPVLLVLCLRAGRILVVRIMPRATGMTVRPGCGWPLAEWLPTSGPNSGARFRRRGGLLLLGWLMQRSYRARKWISIGAAAWLVGSGAFVVSAPPAAEPQQPASGQQEPAAVPNPFSAKDITFRPAPANPLGLTPASMISITAPAPEAELPLRYRLPGASSFAPAPAELFVAEQAPSAPLVALPSPPPTLEGIILPPEQPVAAPLVEVPPAPAPELESAQALAPEAAAESGDVEIAPPQPESELYEMPGFEEPVDAPSSPWPMYDGSAVESVGGEAVDGVVNPEQGPAIPQVSVTTTELTPQLLPAVRRGYALAQRGAMFAARAEFVQVLRRIVQVKDAAANSDAHAQALASGLRAIDEAEDFVPDGVRVEAELDVRIVASSHRTPVLSNHAEGVSPHEAVARYHRYAQEQLAAAVAGEQAGSMALHGLGKVSATLAERGNGDPVLVRNALTMYSASLAACPTNPLSANELGVLLVREGRVEEAARLFERTIDLAPSATAYHNLATAQGKLGFHGEAAANEAESQRLAAFERSTGAVSRRAGVEWVTPEQMSGVAQPGLTPTAGVPPQRKSAWRKTVDMAKALPLPGATKTR